MEGTTRKWEELNKDCLANIFGRVGLESLIWSLPFVCKNWYTASLNPHCWMLLDFQSVIDSKFEKTSFVDLSLMAAMEIWYHKFPLRELVKFAVDRSQGIASEVVLPILRPNFEEVMTYISNSCPMLKTLDLQHGVFGGDNMGCISKLIKYWKILEQLTIPCDFHFQDIISEISTHCKKFASLTTAKDITEEAATAIVTLLPNIRCLNLRGSTLDRENLVHILSQCKKLEFLDVSNCEGFDADDGEIHKMASQIQTILTNGSVVDFDYADDSADDFALDYNEVQCFRSLLNKFAGV